jgi:NAD(P)-dependent dehydrogenase (short-subunit alcohol dehydrogenase family)
MNIMAESSSRDNDLLCGKHAVVTGASRGIGAAIAAALARRGADVTLMSRNQAKLNEQAASLTKTYGTKARVSPSISRNLIRSPPRSRARAMCSGCRTS